MYSNTTPRDPSWFILCIELVCVNTKSSCKLIQNTLDNASGMLFVQTHYNGSWLIPHSLNMVLLNSLEVAKSLWFSQYHWRLI